MKSNWVKAIIIGIIAVLTFLIGNKSGDIFDDSVVCDTVYCSPETIIEYDTTTLYDTTVKYIYETHTDTVIEYNDTGKVVVVHDTKYKVPAPVSVSFADSTSSKLVKVFGRYYYPVNKLDLYLVSKYRPDSWYGRFYISGGMIGSQPGVGILWCNKKTFASFIYGNRRVGVYFGYRFL